MFIPPEAVNAGNNPAFPAAGGGNFKRSSKNKKEKPSC